VPVLDIKNPTLVRGHARLEGREDGRFRVRVGDYVIAADQVVVNTGTRSVIPAIGLQRLQLNIGSMRRRLDAGSVGRNGDCLRRPDIVLARRYVGPTGVDLDRRRTSVGEVRRDQRVNRRRPIGIDIGECGPG